MSRTGVNEQLLNVIEYAVDKKIADMRENFVRTAIKALASDYKYVVVINGSEYTVPSGLGLAFKTGDKVWVHIPYGDYKRAYICATATNYQISDQIVIDITDQVLVNYWKKTELVAATASEVRAIFDDNIDFSDSAGVGGT